MMLTEHDRSLRNSGPMSFMLIKGSSRNFFWHLAMADSRPCACTRHGCLLHGTTACRLDGPSHTRHVRGPVQVRWETRKALERGRYTSYHHVTLLVNPRRSTRRAGKVDQMARGLCLPASTHLIFTSGKHLFNLEPTL